MERNGRFHLIPHIQRRARRQAIRPKGNWDTPRYHLFQRHPATLEQQVAARAVGYLCPRGSQNIEILIIDVDDMGQQRLGVQHAERRQIGHRAQADDRNRAIAAGNLVGLPFPFQQRAILFGAFGDVDTSGNAFFLRIVTNHFHDVGMDGIGGVGRQANSHAVAFQRTMLFE